MNKREEKFNIGLDIGTNSVGWAVTNDNYELLNIKKKNLWGVRLFETAETAETRRSNRSTRRRYRRRKNRINWLNEIFSTEISKIDPSFLIRLQNSWVSKKDPKRQRDSYNLFMDENYSDKDYYSQYPTIFHLRKKLILDDDKSDVRLIYLALHSIIKYRGNFTYEHQKFSISNLNNDLANQLKYFNQKLLDYNISFPDDTDYSKISNLLIISETPTKKIDKMKSTLNMSNDSFKSLQEILKLILGNSADLNKIFSISLAKEDSKLDFSANNIEEKLSGLESLLTEDQLDVLDDANQIFSSITLNEILNGESYLSLAKVKQYEDHQMDLRKLRNLWHSTDDDDAVSKSRRAYKKYISAKNYDIATFYKEIKKFLLIATPTNLAEEALKRIESDTYLVKPRNSNNGVIPFQLNKMEMEKIIDNQSQYYPFLKENKEKLLSILSFRIPYYVGPIASSNNSNFAWMEKKTQEHARPWNFDNVINKEKSSNKFIRRMTVTDTYLIGEPVLPKKSLLYQKYEVLNELNNIRVTEDMKNDPSGSRLSIEIKQRIYNEIFKKKKKVTTNNITKWLIAQSYFVSPYLVGLSRNDEFNSSLSTYIDMKKIFGQSFVEDKSNLNQLERIVEWLTIFEDKQILTAKLQHSDYSYTTEQIKKLASIRYKGWGRISKKLLTTIKVETSTQQVHQLKEYSILDLMWATKRNFISILKDKNYGFNDYINNYNLDKNDETSIADLVDDVHTSPALKRGITQSINVVQELVNFMGHAPKHIFIEFTREDQTSELTDSRKKQVNKLYNHLKKNVNNFKQQLRPYLVPDKDIQDDLKDYDKNLSNERLMLYFMQNGKSLYSDEKLDINELSKYQVDHILPRTYITDNSLENKALVLASENQRKADDLLLDSSIIDRNLERWTYMRDNNMMGLKKFKNLTRRVITDDDKIGFINRQLVQTSQITKSVANILDTLYKDEGTICIQSRANLSSDLRRALSNQDDCYHFEHPELVKNRSVNDYHHAQDAYLACLLGLYRLKKFPTNEMLLIKNEYGKFFGQVKDSFAKNKKMPDSYKNGFIISPLVKGTVQHDNKTGEIIWDLKCRDQIIKTFNYHQYNITKKAEVKTGEFYNQTLYSPKDSKVKNLIPQKDNMDPNLYGGFSGAKPSYIVALKIDNKKIKFVSVPIRLIHKLSSKESLQKWLEDTIKHRSSIEIIKSKIPLGQIAYSKETGYLAFKSGSEIVNAQQLNLSPNYVALITLLQRSDIKPEQILNFYDNDILIDIFKEILQKMELFYPYYHKEYEFLQNNIENLSNSTLEEQINTILQMLNFLHANSTNANLKFKNVTKNRFGRKGNGLSIKKVDLIYQSVTGLYETKFHIE